MRHPLALTIDFEELRNTWAGPYLPKKYHDPVCRDILKWLITKLKSTNNHATFFVLGDVIKDYRNEIGDLSKLGHEIGCHAYSHTALYRLTPEKFRDEIEKFKKEISEINESIEIRGFRAPTFSIQKDMNWVFKILKEQGFKYDSSIFPIRNPVYGIPGARSLPYRMDAIDFLKEDTGSEFFEFPLSTLSVLGFRIPVGGGIYFRAFPEFLNNFLIRKSLDKGPVSIYLHPWELLEDFPKDVLPLRLRLTMGLNINKSRNRLQKLLEKFQFLTMFDILNSNF